MSLRRRIMLLVTIGLIVATAPLGVMGIGMLRAATDRVLAERLAMTRGMADHLNDRLMQGRRQLDALGRQVAPLWAVGDTDRLRAAVAAVAPSLTLFSGEVFLVDPVGRIVAQAPGLKTLRPPSLGALEVIRQTLLTARAGVSRLVPIPGGTPAIVFTVPVLDDRETVLGVAGGIMVLPSPTLQGFIDPLAVGATGHAAIVDDTGVVLASTNPQELFTRNEHPEFLARLVAEGRARIGTTADPPDAGGAENHIMAFAPLTAARWGLTIGQDEAETFGPIRALRDRMVLFGLVVLAAALFFAWLDTGAVAAPLRLLKEAAEAIAGGDLGRKITVRRSDEVGLLGASFERMRVQLQASLLENARLQERVQSLAVLEERERIAREIHDGVGQVLGYVNTKVQAVKVLLDAGKTAAAQAQLEQLAEAGREVYADLREAILGLRTETSPDRRFLPALQEYARRFGELSGVATVVDVAGDPAGYAFSPTTELHLLRIIQEALTNVRKHAGARRAWVRLTEDERSVTITVGDDGAGFDPDRLPPGAWPRFGLQTMRERTESIGGTFSIQPRGGAGTEVVVRLPRPEAGGVDARPAGG